jgi:hypothetical protein
MPPPAGRHRRTRVSSIYSYSTALNRPAITLLVYLLRSCSQPVRMSYAATVVAVNREPKQERYSEPLTGHCDQVVVCHYA